MINVRNSLPVNNTNFGSLYSFKKSLDGIDLSKFIDIQYNMCLWYLCKFDLSSVSYIVFLLVFRFYKAAIIAVNAALFSCHFYE